MQKIRQDFRRPCIADFRLFNYYFFTDSRDVSKSNNIGDKETYFKSHDMDKPITAYQI